MLSVGIKLIGYHCLEESAVQCYLGSLISCWGWAKKGGGKGGGEGGGDGGVGGPWTILWTSSLLLEPSLLSSESLAESSSKDPTTNSSSESLSSDIFSSLIWPLSLLFFHWILHQCSQYFRTPVSCICVEYISHICACFGVFISQWVFWHTFISQMSALVEVIWNTIILENWINQRLWRVSERSVFHKPNYPPGKDSKDTKIKHKQQKHIVPSKFQAQEASSFFELWSVSHHTSYLSFFLHEQNFWRIKFTPKKRVNYDKIHSKLPIFCVITAKYTVNCQLFALNL